ncbi:MAG: hypothetical protein E7233_06205 [Lachnospiraceae bacterium]|nr:hypothetical protein [Lachnospiraceae bacterium]
MARPKKNGTYLNVCIKTPIYERLEAMCDNAGQSKTVAVERALTLYLDEYEDKQRKLQAFEASALNLKNEFERKYSGSDQ